VFTKKIKGVIKEKDNNIRARKKNLIFFCFLMNMFTNDSAAAALTMKNFQLGILRKMNFQIKIEAYQIKTL